MYVYMHATSHGLALSSRQVSITAALQLAISAPEIYITFHTVNHIVHGINGLAKGCIWVANAQCFLGLKYLLIAS